jgi:DNA-binding response OmpR family regulator
MILIIESNFIVALSLKKSLKMRATNVVIKATLKDAIDIISQNKLECIIAAEEILTEYGQNYNIHNYLIKKNIPIVFLTATGLKNPRYDLNIIGTHYKPFDPDDILASKLFFN